MGEVVVEGRVWRGRVGRSQKSILSRQVVKPYDLTRFVHRGRKSLDCAGKIDRAKTPLLQLERVKQSTVVVVISDDVTLRTAGHNCQRKSSREVDGSEIAVA